MWVNGHSRSLKCHYLTDYTSFYQPSIVITALSCIIFELLDMKKYCDLEIQVKRHSRPLEIAPFNFPFLPTTISFEALARGLLRNIG